MSHMSEARREFSLKNLRRALLAAARSTARNLASHGQPVLVLREGEVVAMEPAPHGRQRRKAARA
jgi:hypothetical protein